MMTYVSPTASSTSGNHTIVIGAGIDTAYNVTSISLEKNTQYTIIFEIFEEDGFHNLIIDQDNDVSDINTDDNGDKHIGIASTATGLGGETVWSSTWTTPDEDITITYFCGIPGHFSSGMKGVFIIGEGSSTSAPGFEVFFLLISVFGLALLKKRN